MGSTRRKGQVNRKKVIIISAIVLIVLLGLIALIQILRARVSARFGNNGEAEVLSAQVTVEAGQAFSAPVAG